MYKCAWPDNEGIDHTFVAEGWTWNADQPGPNGELPDTWKIIESVQAVVAAMKAAGYEYSGRGRMTLETRCQTS
jgi:hypothetical protein